MNLEYIKQLKKEKKMTSQQISDISGVPKSTIDKILVGATKDPKLDTLRAIANALGCRVEDFVDNPLPAEAPAEAPEYYLSPEVSQMAQEIYDNPELRILFDASRKLEKEDILTVVSLVKRMKGYND